MNGAVIVLVALVLSHAAAAQEVARLRDEDLALDLFDKSQDVRQRALEELLVRRPEFEPLRQRLQRLTGEADMRGVPRLPGRRGVLDVRGFGPDPAQLAKNLDSTNPSERSVAVESVARLGLGAAEYQEKVLALAGDEDIGVRATVAKYVGQLGWNDRVREVVIVSLKSDDVWVRKCAARGLAAGGEDPGAIAALRGVLHDPDLDVRAAALRSLGRCGAAGGGLARRGAARRGAVRDIVGMMRDREAKVRIAAIEAVTALRLRGERAVLSVQRCLGESDRKVVVAALRAVTEQGVAAALALDRVRELSFSARDEIRRLAYPAMWRIVDFPRRGEVALWTIAAMASSDKRTADRAFRLLTDARER